MPENQILKIKRLFRYLTIMIAVMFILSISIAAVGYFSNKSRVHDIQASRTESCERTYESFREILTPLFPLPKHRTAEQNRLLNLLNTTINDKKSGCKKQVLVR